MARHGSRIPPPVLELTGMACGYGALRVVHDLDLVVGSGQLTALIGANGAGKSSTLMAVAGHVVVQAGSIRLQGRDITALTARARVRLGIAVVPEGRRLFADLSIAENLRVGGYSRPRRHEGRNRERVLELFPRLGDRLRQRAGSLSGGEQQMLAIGRALMAEPRLLLIDELSLGLMPRAVEDCYAALARLRGEDLAILLVEQNTALALEMAEQVCALESGRVVWRGSADQARADPDLIDACLGLQRAPEGATHSHNTQES